MTEYEYKIVTWCGFRTHILLPSRPGRKGVVGSIIDDKPTWPGLTAFTHDDTTEYSRDGWPILRMTRFPLKHRAGRATRVTIRALTEVWVQEMGLTIRIAGEGAWYAMHRSGWYEGPYTLRNIEDPFKNTKHFSRVRGSENFTRFLDYKVGRSKLRIRSALPGFARLLDRAVRPVPWPGCSVFGKDWDVAGAYVPAYEHIRRIELSGGARLHDVPPNTTQLHWTQWTGGAGAVVNAEGHTPPPGTNVTKDMGYDRLHNPLSWRRLLPGHAALYQDIVLTVV